MSTSETDSMDDHPPTSRTRAIHLRADEVTPHPESRYHHRYHHRYRRAGREDCIKWGRADLKLGKFRFSDFLDCTDCAEVSNIGGRLSERVFIYNNLLNPGTGYTPQQLIYGISSGIPGIFQIPRHPGALFARSLQRMISGIHYAQERGAPIPLGDDFPYEPGDQVHFLGPRGRIGQGYILSKSGRDYRLAHSGT